MNAAHDMPYWMRGLGRHLRAHCMLQWQLPFVVKRTVLHLIRIEGENRLLHTHRGLF